jgi:hypothetical protein
VFRLSTKVQSHHPVNINPTFKVCGTVFLPNLNKNYDVSDRIFNDVSDRTPKRLVHCSRDSPDPWIPSTFRNMFAGILFTGSTSKHCKIHL